MGNHEKSLEIMETGNLVEITVFEILDMKHQMQELNLDGQNF